MIRGAGAVRGLVTAVVVTVRAAPMLMPWKGSRGKGGGSRYLYECSNGHRRSLSRKMQGSRNCPTCGKKLKYVGRG